MIAMHYQVQLPGDYPMDIFHWRIREEEAGSDGMPGLVFKACMIAEKGSSGNQGNYFIPFYLWESVVPMNEFLLGGPFDRSVRTLGWNAVYHWSVICAHGIEAKLPLYAVLDRQKLKPFTDLSGVLREEREESLAEGKNCTAIVRGYSPHKWEIWRFHMGRDPGKLPRKRGENLYQVLHLTGSLPAVASVPEADRLAAANSGC